MKRVLNIIYDSAAKSRFTQFNKAWVVPKERLGYRRDVKRL